MTNEKKIILQELELLIIDEISMVRCDTIDAITLFNLESHCSGKAIS
jgi:hypothetical protein